MSSFSPSGQRIFSHSWSLIVASQDRPVPRLSAKTRCGLTMTTPMFRVDCQLSFLWGWKKLILMIPGHPAVTVRMFCFFFFSEDVQNNRHLRLSKIFFQPWEQCLQGRKSTNCITGPGCFFGLPTFNRQNSPGNSLPGILVDFSRTALEA